LKKRLASELRKLASVWIPFPPSPVPAAGRFCLFTTSVNWTHVIKADLIARERGFMLALSASDTSSWTRTRGICQPTGVSVPPPGHQKQIRYLLLGGMGSSIGSYAFSWIFKAFHNDADSRESCISRWSCRGDRSSRQCH
jgi:hypothetical protein